MTLGVRELREAALSFAIYEHGRRELRQEPELASLSDEQLRDLIDDLLNAGRHRGPLDCEGVAYESGKTVRGKASPRIMQTILTTLISLTLALTCGATTYNSNGTDSDVQSLVNGAVNGDRITLPAGTFTWNNGVSVSGKAIGLKGKGSGRIIGNTKTSASIGTGSKTFTTTRSIPGLVAGTTLRIAKMPSLITGQGRGNYMEGTVTSYADTTLVMNVTSTGGSGTYQFWWIATKPKTIVITNAALSLSESSAGNIDVSGIQFIAQASSIAVSGNDYITPKALIHDCWFQAQSAWPNIVAYTNQALIWNCSFDDTFSQQAVGIQVKAENDTFLPSWRTNSTMGTADTSGATNFYVEDSDFHGYLNAADWDGNARAVVRKSTFDNSGMTSHGADTGPIGMRHIELYNNEFIFDNFGDCDGSITAALAWFYWHRGGTAVFTNNIMPDINSCAWNTKPSFRFTVLNIWRGEGCYPCWTSYPAPHQVGQGFVAGTPLLDWNCTQYIDDARYGLYLEPVYIWSNTGPGATKVSVDNDTEGDNCHNGQDVSQYVQAGRDYIVGTAKPGYHKFAYPHPLR